MQKERAASALKHGLPVPTPLPTRLRGSDARSSRPPGTNSSSRPPPRAGLPLAVKLVGLALGLLGLVYGLTVFRDHLASVEAALASSASAGAPKPPKVAAELNAASLSSQPAAATSVK
jgi:hypothetical protein